MKTIETILDKSSSQAIWESMANKYQDTAKVSRADLQALYWGFELLHMKEEESINENFDKILAIVNKKLEEHTIVEKIVMCMSSKFNYAFCAIEESNNVREFSIYELHRSLLFHAQGERPTFDSL